MNYKRQPIFFTADGMSHQSVVGWYWLSQEFMWFETGTSFETCKTW